MEGTGAGAHDVPTSAGTRHPDPDEEDGIGGGPSTGADRAG
jgi:hypothetical protein